MSSAFLNIYRAEFVDAWARSRRVPMRMLDIPPSKAELKGRVNTFDGGHTAKWLRDLEAGGRDTWRAIRDVDTGHTIHIVGDRAALDPGLVADMDLALRIVRFLTKGPPVVIYAWDQDWPRLLPVDEEPGRIHINGGWAVPGVREVHVYRREEFHKVLIHEAIHALSLDIPHEKLVALRHRLESEELSGRRLWPHLGECYTELFAEWIWTIVRDRRPSVRSAAQHWEAQLRCSRGQAATVWGLIRRWSPGKSEDTNVFAYYVLKYVLMEHAEAVLGTVGTATRSVEHWMGWWRAMRPEIERLDPERGPKGAMRMGMTCEIPM